MINSSKSRQFQLAQRDYLIIINCLGLSPRRRHRCRQPRRRHRRRFERLQRAEQLAEAERLKRAEQLMQRSANSASSFSGSY